MARIAVAMQKENAKTLAGNGLQTAQSWVSPVPGQHLKFAGNGELAPHGSCY